MRANWPTSRGTTRSTKVYVGLSGGVDSAVSAARLVKEGYDVTGVFIRIALPGYPCSAGIDKLDAMRVAAHLKIPFVEIDLSEAYRARVFEVSMGEFAAGRTPNPDTLCNREIKFGLFYDWCMSHGADLVATGHYAQTKEGLLYTALDDTKDQSYFLYMVPGERLAKTLFPIGGMRKTDVRKEAKRLGLPNAERPDSQGLCFLGDISIDDMLHQELTLVPGDVLNEAGEVVGRHEGVPAYTLGQRHGFELFVHEPNMQPHFVIGKDAEFNTITVSTSKFPQHATAVAIDLEQENWIGDVEDGQYLARYRYRGQLIPATRTGSRVVLHEPHYVPLGQSLVLYKGSRCVGGGIIREAWLS